MRFRIERTDLWNLLGKYPIAITTNGHVKKDGRATMGKGVAEQALTRFPGIDIILGHQITHSGTGNSVYILRQTTTEQLIAFPTKPKNLMVESAEQAKLQVCRHMQERFKYPTQIPGWAARSSLGIIERSLIQLNQLAGEHGWSAVAMPVPGVGSGELSESAVLALIEQAGPFPSNLELILCKLPDRT